MDQAPETAAVTDFPTIPPDVLALAPSRRRRPVVVDANALIEDVLWRSRTDFSALTFLGQMELAALVAPVHVLDEVREHLPAVALRTGCPVELAVEVFETVHVPLMRFVEVPRELPEDSRVADVASRDADDVPLAYLATLVAPAVVLTRDRHLTRAGFGQSDWLNTILLLRRLAELDAMVWGGSRLAWLSLYLPALAARGFARQLMRSEVALGLTFGLIVGAGLYLRPQLRSAATNAWGRVEPVVADLAEATMRGYEARAEAEQALEARLVAPVGQATPASTAARYLTVQSQPVPSKRIHAWLVEHGHDISPATTGQMLRAHPSFVPVRGRGFQLGGAFPRGPVSATTSGEPELAPPPQ